MRTSNWDRVITSAPLDAKAATVRDSESIDHWEAKVADTQPRWFAPPLPVKPRPDAVPDLSGVRFGRMVVVRYHDNHPKVGSKWLCRCSCGYYETRKTKAITANKNTDHSCSACNYIGHIAYVQSSNRSRAADAALLDRLAKPRPTPTQTGEETR